MDKVIWTVDDNHFRLTTPYGVATIVEQREDFEDKFAVGARYSYTAYFKHKDGTIESSRPEFHFLSFDEAEGWVLWSRVMDIDLVEGTELRIKRLFASLNLSRKFLPGNEIDIHQKRIRVIKQLLRRNCPDIDQDPHLVKDKVADHRKFMEEFPPLVWHEEENEYSVELDQGRAVIKEVRNQNKWIVGRVSTFYPRIEYQGEVFNGLEALSFEEAERWIKSRTFAMNHPDNEATQRAKIQETLALCIRALPDDTNPLHYLRLQYVKDRMAEIL